MCVFVGVFSSKGDEDVKQCDGRDQCRYEKRREGGDRLASKPKTGGFLA